MNRRLVPLVGGLAAAASLVLVAGCSTSSTNSDSPSSTPTASPSTDVSRGAAAGDDFDDSPEWTPPKADFETSWTLRARVIKNGTTSAVWFSPAQVKKEMKKPVPGNVVCQTFMPDLALQAKDLPAWQTVGFSQQAGSSRCEAETKVRTSPEWNAAKVAAAQAAYPQSAEPGETRWMVVSQIKPEYLVPVR